MVGAPLKRSSDRHHVEEHLQELARLADTAGAEVVGSLTQQLDRPHPGTYLGKGKVDELRQLAQDRGATLVLFDDELSPAQGRNIEQMLNVRVMDRAELILDIFATRARTNEAKMQVELAQLEYMLPRLTRMWTHLEKTRGGIGMRGPGETQLETDRRLVNHRIRVLKERLADVERSREVQRSSRRREFRAALVGYTNAGKSSILRGLSGASDVFVEDRLFATLDPLTRETSLGEGYRVLVTDTVGFIRKLPHDLVASFRATLEETREADLLLHVIDASHPSWEEQREVVEEVLAEIGAQERPVLYVFNKTDALEPETVEALRQRAHGEGIDAVFVSALAPDGLAGLRAALRARAEGAFPLVALTLPPEDGAVLARLYKMADVVDVASDADGDGALRVTARVPGWLIPELQPYRAG
ncbi:GTPase HflX [Roseisolibacter sp. H3M3-2]|uniref:GTPase HflX n=1 Tax=Roseisolibacter sp. H3M3-2 TaxID=3031323 RepID=UPI0023DAE071|nr:GTPase HflX [Roseisolibacter sp. H3M3-2]MDF1503035.1 GTPase HflX [Roseisolibacter sp. H3M3-2]